MATEDLSNKLGYAQTYINHAMIVESLKRFSNAVQPIALFYEVTCCQQEKNKKILCNIGLYQIAQQQPAPTNEGIETFCHHQFALATSLLFGLLYQIFSSIALLTALDFNQQAYGLICTGISLTFDISPGLQTRETDVGREAIHGTAQSSSYNYIGFSILDNILQLQSCYRFWTACGADKCLYPYMT